MKSKLSKLLYCLYLSIFLIITVSYAGAVVDVGVVGVAVSDLSPDYPTDKSPEPGEAFEVDVAIKNYGDEATEGSIELYLEDEKKGSWGTFSIKPEEVVSNKFMITHDNCGTYNVRAKIVMRNNTPGHDWEREFPVKIGKGFHVTITPEKALVNRPVQIDIKDDMGLNVEHAEVWVGNIYNIQYKRGLTDKNEVFSFTPEHTGEVMIKITKDEEGYCAYKKIIEVKHNLSVYGPYPDDPIVGDEMIIRVYNENREPIHGVSITVTGAENRYLNSGRRGEVMFFVNKAGEYHLEIEKNLPMHWGVNKTLYVRAKPMLMMTISPEKPVLGDDVTIKILNENISYANITITNPEGFGRTLKTDKNNEISFEVKLLGDYVVCAEHVDYTGLTEKIAVYNLLEILVEPETPVMGENITITILDQDDYPVPNAVVSIKGNKDDEFTASTDHNGEIKFKSKSKKYEILAEKKDHINASAAVSVLVKKLSLKLNLKKLKFNKGTIHISVNDEDTKSPVSAKITIDGENTGFKHEETASELTFKPEFADNYKISVTKENYGGVEDSFVVEPVPMDVDPFLEEKELVIKITSDSSPLQGVDVSVKTPKNKIIATTDDKGILRINIDDGKCGNYLIQASKTPNYNGAELGVEIIKNQGYWWAWLILLIILVAGIIVWRF